MTDNTTLPAMDDNVQMSDNGQTEQSLLDAVLSNSDFIENEASLPNEEVPEVDPVESDEVEDPEESDETVTEEGDEEEVDETEDEDAEATQETDVFTADDLDLDAKVRVKIDGEELDVSFADLLKGYQTDSSLSKKGRELGEAKKALEDERAQALAEVQELGNASAAILVGTEQNLAKEYHDIEAKIDTAREAGDTYEVSELKDQREQVQKRYWNARKQREGLQEQLKVQQQSVQEQLWEEQLTYFNDNIEAQLPGFNAEMAAEIRNFAVGEGVSEGLVDSIVDPNIVRLLNDYRVLKQGVTKGQAKRKAAPSKKAVPTKKAKSPNRQKQDASKMTKARAFREDASSDDQMAFLRDYAANSLKL